MLAGGNSTRMGQDKASITFANNSLLAHTKAIMHHAGIKETVVSGNNYQVADLYPNQGPVSGILSVIAQYRPQSLIILPVDMPLITSELIKQLIMHGQLKQQATFYQGNRLPLFLPINGFTELAMNKVKQQMSLNSNSQQTKGPSIQDFLENVPQQALKISDERLLINTNTPNQLQLALQQYSKRNKHEQFKANR